MWPVHDPVVSVVTQASVANVDTVLIAGTVTNVCCESSARDASTTGFRVVMLADGNSASTVDEHRASLDTFALFFGDVMTVDEAAARLVPAQQRKTA